jgi:pimeloyl-ACP methyl ester carboxylesterase
MAIVRVNGIDLQVSRFRTGPEGERPVIVAIHGLGVVDNASMSMTLGLPLARFFDVVLYDLRGHGRSQFVTSGFRVVDHVSDLVALLDALEIPGPVHLLTGSYGGTIGIVAAKEHPERVASLSMVDPMFPLPDWGENLAKSLEWFGSKLDSEASIEEMMELFQTTARRRANAIAERGRRLLQETTMLDDIRSEPSMSVEEYATIACPMLAVFGIESEIYVLSMLLEELVPGVEIVRVPDANHIQVFGRPETREAIADFVRRVEAPERRAARQAEPLPAVPPHPNGLSPG